MDTVRLKTEEAVLTTTLAVELLQSRVAVKIQPPLDMRYTALSDGREDIIYASELELPVYNRQQSVLLVPRFSAPSR